MSDIRNEVHPVDAGLLPVGYSIMNTGQGRLRFRVYYNRKPIGAPKGSIRAARVFARQHHDDLVAVRREPEPAAEVDAQILELLRSHREAAGGVVR